MISSCPTELNLWVYDICPWACGTALPQTDSCLTADVAETSSQLPRIYDRQNERGGGEWTMYIPLSPSSFIYQNLKTTKVTKTRPLAGKEGWRQEGRLGASTCLKCPHQVCLARCLTSSGPKFIFPVARNNPRHYAHTQFPLGIWLSQEMIKQPPPNPRCIRSLAYITFLYSHVNSIRHNYSHFTDRKPEASGQNHIASKW